MNISIVGLGYVGTVSAACLAAKGHRIWGIDVNRNKVDIINEGRSPVVEPGLDDRVRQARESGRLHATDDIAAALAQTEACFISVATPSRKNGQIDASHLLRSCEQIAGALRTLRKSQVVVIRSSVLPTSFDQCGGVFNDIAPGLVTLCANPEFLREGCAVADFEDPPFTVIGTDDAAGEALLRAVYADLTAPVFVLPPKEALMLKYASNAFHALKVTFANEIDAICRQIQVDGRRVMSVFCQDPKLNVSPRYLMPGFAFGGSCLPKDVRAVLYAAKQADLELPLISAILPSNEGVINRAFAEIREQNVRRIGLIGLSFKANTDDLRESPLVELAERLLGKGYELRIYDPNVSVARLTGANKEYIERVIPHLSQLLVASMDELAGEEMLVVGHRFPALDHLLARTEAVVIDLADSAKTRHRAVVAAGMK